MRTKQNQYVFKQLTFLTTYETCNANEQESVCHKGTKTQEHLNLKRS
jgi:hypothetical protein